MQVACQTMIGQSDKDKVEPVSGIKNPGFRPLFLCAEVIEPQNPPKTMSAPMSDVRKRRGHADHVLGCFEPPKIAVFNAVKRDLNDLTARPP